MANRTVKTSLVAEVNGYISGMQSAARATRELGTENEKLAQKREALNTLATGLGVIGTVAAAAVGLAVSKFAEFDAKMSQVRSLSHASAETMRELREEALTAGQQIGFSASEAADAQIELVKAGVSTADIMGGALTGALNLAAAGQINVAESTQIAGVAMTQFKLAGADVPHLADLLAAGADKALGGVDQLGQALNQSGLVASQFGLSIEDTVGTLAAFANAGLLGSDAGTSFKSMLQALANPTGKTAELMQELGLNFYDAQGQFVGITGAAGILKDRLSGLTQEQRNAALAQIFGSDAVRAASVLYEQGADGIQGWIDNVNDSGFAAEQAQGKLDNLQGDLKKLQSAFEVSLIQTGSSSDGVLRNMVQTVTGLIGAYNSAPAPIQGTALAVLALTAAVGLGGAAFLGIVPKVAEAKIAMETLGITAQTTRSRLAAAGTFLTGPWGIAIATAVAAATLFVSAQVQSAEYVTRLRDSLNETTGAMTKNTKELVANALAAKQTIFGLEIGPSAYDKAKKLGLSLETVTKAAQGNTQAYKELKAVQDEITTSDDNDAITKKYGEGLSGAARDVTELVQAVEKQRGAMSDAKEQQKQLTEATKEGSDAADGSASSSGGAAAGLDGLGDSADDAAQAVDDVAKALHGLTSPTLDAREAQRQFEAALDSVGETIKSNKDAYNDAGTSLDIATEEGRQNQAVLDSIASSSQDLAGKLYAQTGSQDQATAAMQRGRDELVAALGQYGITGQAAEDYANEIIGTPTEWATAFTNNATGQPLGDVATYTGSIYGVPNSKETELKAQIATASQNLQNLKNQIGTVPAAKETQLRAEIDAAQANLRSLKGDLDRIQSKSVTITANYVYNNLRTGDGTAGNGLGVMKANGGVVDYYADGGFGGENHVAEIAPAGAWRLWAEPETGGEAYIPLAPSKRARSLAIWEETGRRLQAFADGGFSRPTYVPTPPQVIYAQQAAAAAAPPAPRIGRVEQTIVAADPVAAGMSVIRRLNALGA